jgi:hypothetical protein
VDKYVFMISGFILYCTVHVSSTLSTDFGPLSPVAVACVRCPDLCRRALCREAGPFLEKNVGTREWKTAKFARHCVDPHRVEELEWIHMGSADHETHDESRKWNFRFVVNEWLI